MTEAMFRVLVVEDDPDIQGVLRTVLEAARYRVVIATTAARALIETRSHQPDVVLVDLGLPDRDGQSLIREIRAFSAVPILVLSARTLEAEKIQALDGGADDYVTKPFSTAELVSRVRANLRRRELDRGVGTASVVTVAGVRIDLARHVVTVDGRDVELTPSEFKVLVHLAEHAGQALSRTQIMEHLWQSPFVGDARACDAHISNLRRKLERDPSHPERIVTVREVGYKLVEA